MGAPGKSHGATGDRINMNTQRNEFSWDQLEEDEHGRLRASVRSWSRFFRLLSDRMFCHHPLANGVIDDYCVMLL